MSNVPAFMAERQLNRSEVPIRRRSGPAGHLTVACILDDFSAACFSPEVDLSPLTMRDWRAELIATQPDMLLIESAWRGHRQTWWNQVFRMGPEIRGVLEWCRERNIPTAFWNKEDPVHYRTFLTLAKEFDAVFTTDLDMVGHYRAALGHHNVHFLPFAAQPSIHNPIEEFRRIEGCAFAGAYYKKYPERTEDLGNLSESLASVAPFHIYDRNFGGSDPDYAFPESYQTFIVGGLAPDQINVAYKGYTTNLNLNSVKQSQSMFARRVYELMASGTLVVSNFSRGLRTMFGELAIVSDSPGEIQTTLQRVDSVPNGRERLRAMALRKVMAQHTYGERIAFIAHCLGLIEAPRAAAPRVLMVAPCGDEEDVEASVRTALSQSHPEWLLATVGPAGGSPRDDRVRHFVDDEQAMQWGRSQGAEHAALLDPKDWYSPSYLSDLVATLEWADVKCVGLDEHFRLIDGIPTRTRAGHGWQMARELAPTRCMVTGEGWHRISSLSEWANATFDGLAVGALGYCAGGRQAGAEHLASLDDLQVDLGSDLAVLRDHSRALDPPDMPASQWDFDLPRLQELFPATAEVAVELDDLGRVHVRSELESGMHRYVYLPPMDIDGNINPLDRTVMFSVGPGLDVTLAVIFLDGAGNRLGHAMANNGHNTPVVAPPGAELMQLGLRVKGRGDAIFERLTGETVLTAPSPVIVPSSTLLVSNIYPDYHQLYRNAFVHSRVKAYRRHGADVDVMVVDPRIAGRRFREFENVDVTVCDAATLDATLQLGQVSSVLVHGPTPEVWNVLAGHPELDRVAVWVHGFEIQPWWRRAFNLSTEAERNAAKEVSDARMAFWRAAFENFPSNFEMVFVSRQFAATAFEDVGRALEPHQYRVIHNPIDTDLFRYVAKDSSQATRVLSIRPYVNATYANDLAVAAVLHLSEREGFEDLSFSFHGDGPLFDATLAPLQKFPNVTIHKGFLRHDEIAALHRSHGIFLVPTRMDTQGVSRDEAMSSGMVPVTTAVAAVPEFVDETCGALVPGEDSWALAEAVWSLAHAPDVFLEKSEKAAQRVRRQTSVDVVIPQELSILPD
ncbi:glycosyltransferase family protein [Aestuariimicrobium sp. T2.26MG-19.2B]|uniref:glycosyltransferase family protein n=1 Tax=Aestuariimicrobium sp. T2.26MG-19.2B TaxID=3040679 RepID=UPI00247799D0|nr:glycosyltransferase [Aestuariimicrobium sp. T2.26MG-19.2B]CAI9406288.1 hypothetical protein AESSP_01596 [Aestuariimicrobium sp. T2.26MG-19.2B]